MRVALFLMLIPVLAGFARTGSRMGLLALGAGMLLFFIFATAMERMAILVGGILFVALAVTLLPQRIADRFTTYFKASSAAQLEAASSAETRKMLFLRSIQLSFEHPIFGVGPGEFMDAEAEEAAAAGKTGHVALHPQLLHRTVQRNRTSRAVPFPVCLLARRIRAVPDTNRYRFSRVGRGALFLQIAVLMSCIGAFFLSIAYSGLLYAILGISAAYRQAVDREVKEAEKTPSEGAGGGKHRSRRWPDGGARARAVAFLSRADHALVHVQSTHGTQSWRSPRYGFACAATAR